jgi:hypothetical protein
MHMTPEGHEVLARAALPLLESQIRAEVPGSDSSVVERR